MRRNESASYSGNQHPLGCKVIPMKAAIYTRISKDSTLRGEGVARQEAACRELVEKRGWNVYRLYSDNDISASFGAPRPGYEAMLADIEQGKIDVVVCWHTDRLTRRVSDLEEYIAVCQPAGVPTHTVQSGPIDLTTPSGRMVARTLGAVAQYEMEQKSARQKAANRARALLGKHFSTRRCFGYDEDGLTIREHEAQAVREAAGQIVGGTKSFHAVARDWNAAGLLPAHGKRRTKQEKDDYARAVEQALQRGEEPPLPPPLQPSRWTGATLVTFFKNPRIAGIKTYQRKIVRDPETGEPIAGEWPPLLDRSTWDRILAVIEHNAKERRFPSAERHLLSGLALCAQCGAKLAGGGTRNGRSRYRCRADGSHVYREGKPIEDYIERVVVKRLSQPDALEVFTPPAERVDVAAITRQLADIDAREAELGTAYANGEATLAQLTAANAAFAAQRERLQSQLPVTPSPAVQQLIDADDVPATWASLSQDAKRNVIDSLMTIEVIAPGTKENAYLDWRKRIINPDTVEITWKTS